jgi:anti-anti-sigma regulatory factor
LNDANLKAGDTTAGKGAIVRDTSFGSQPGRELDLDDIIVFGDPFDSDEEQQDDGKSVTSQTPLVPQPSAALATGTAADSRADRIAKRASGRAEALTAAHCTMSRQADTLTLEAQRVVLAKLDEVLGAPPPALVGMTREAALRLLHLRGIVIDGCRIVHVDAHAARELLDTIKTFDKGETGIRIVLASVPGPVRDTLHRLGVLPALGYKHVHQTVSAAVSALVGKSQYALWTASLASYGQLLDVLLPGSASLRNGSGAADQLKLVVDAAAGVGAAPRIGSLEIDSLRAARVEAAVSELT